MFKSSQETKVSYTKTPEVQITDNVLMKMKAYTNASNNEIAWLLCVKPIDESTYRIFDAILFEQEVTCTTADITEESLTAFASEILKKPDGVEVWNSIAGWGHSHVNMNTSPSGTDNRQMEEFEATGMPYAIRIITNQKGDINIDLFNYKTGIIYLGLDYTPVKMNKIQELELLKEEIEKNINEIYEEEYLGHKEKIMKEIKEKVTEKTYWSGAKYYKRNAAGNNLSKKFGEEDLILKIECSRELIGSSDFVFQDLEINTFDDVYNFFEDDAINEMIGLDKEEVIKILKEEGIYNALTQKERNIIYEYMKNDENILEAYMSAREKESYYGLY